MQGLIDYLLSIGYKSFILDCKTMKYKEKGNTPLSTMVNLDYRLFHKNDPIISKIRQGCTISNEIKKEDRSGEIIIGLSEVGKPPTLIYPRPKIMVLRSENGLNKTYNEQGDNEMNIVLQKFTLKEVFNSMYNTDVILKIDLTKS